MMAEMDVLIQRTLRQQQEQLGASIALVRRLATPTGPVIEHLQTYMCTCIHVCIIYTVKVNKGLEKTAESQQAHADLIHK